MAASLEDDAAPDTPDTPEQEKLGTRCEVEVLGGCKRRLKASVPADKIREQIDESYKELANTVQLPGFRRGRVPRKLLEARFGEEIAKDLKENLVKLSFGEAVEDQKLKIVGSPKFENIQFAVDADLTYEVELELEPEFQLPTYKGIEATREPIPVTDEEVEEQLGSLRQSRSTLSTIDLSAAGADDVYYGKYHLLRDGVRVKSSDTVAFTPSRKVLDAFSVEDLAEKMKGWDAASGAPLCLDVKVPPTFPDEVLRGVDLQLQFTLDEVRHVDLPPLDDAFAKELGKETLAELREEVRQSIAAKHRRQEDAKIETAIIDKILANVSMELPEGLVEAQASRWRQNREYELLVEQGMSAEQVKEAIEKEGASAGEDLRREMKLFFCLDRIGEEEKIFVTEDEVDDRVRLMAAYYGAPAARLREQMRESGRIEDLRANLRQDKVRAFLRRKARILGPDGQPEAAAGEATQEQTPAVGGAGASSALADGIVTAAAEPGGASSGSGSPGEPTEGDPAAPGSASEDRT